jgi:hypothetical protein
MHLDLACYNFVWHARAECVLTHGARSFPWSTRNQGRLHVCE